MQLRRHRRWLRHQLRGVGGCEAMRGRGRYNGHLRWRAHACTGCRWVKLKHRRICTRAHLLLSQLPVHRFGGPPGNAHLCSNLLPHLVLESNTRVSIDFFGVYCAETRRVRVRECAGVHLKPKMWAQNEGTDDQNEAVWAFRVVEWYIPCVESCEFVFLLFVPNGSLLEVVLIP